MTISLIRLAAPLLLSVGLLTTTAPQAATTTLVGLGFDLSFDPELLSLFGMPTLQGNTIAFTPVGFKAESLDGQGEVVSEKAMRLQLFLHPGQRVTAVTLTEQGSYRLSGQQSDVSVWGELQADFSGGAQALVAAITPTDYFFPNNGAVQAWSASGNLDLGGVSRYAQSQGITLDLHNVLQGFTRRSDVGLRVASIEMGGSLVVGVSVVPEPASQGMMLMGLGILGIAAVGRNRGR
jgi:hypothetical protein